MGNKQTRVLIAGLKNTGKTALFARLTGQPVAEVHVPTETANEGETVFQGHRVVLTDVPGDFAARRQWDAFYDTTDGLVFVIDAAKLQKRVQEAATAFWTVLSDKRMRNVPALVLVNKCDLLPATAAKDDVAALVQQRLQVDEMGVDAKVMPVSLKDGSGIEEGLDWLLGAVARARKVKLHDI